LEEKNLKALALVASSPIRETIVSLLDGEHSQMGFRDLQKAVNRTLRIDLKDGSLAWHLDSAAAPRKAPTCRPTGQRPRRTLLLEAIGTASERHHQDRKDTSGEMTEMETVASNESAIVSGAAVSCAGHAQSRPLKPRQACIFCE
jgi:hypothetical protein